MDQQLAVKEATMIMKCQVTYDINFPPERNGIFPPISGGKKYGDIELQHICMADSCMSTSGFVCNELLQGKQMTYYQSLCPKYDNSLENELSKSRSIIQTAKYTEGQCSLQLAAKAKIGGSGHQEC